MPDEMIGMFEGSQDLEALADRLRHGLSRREISYLCTTLERRRFGKPPYHGVERRRTS